MKRSPGTVFPYAFGLSCGKCRKKVRYFILSSALVFILKDTIHPILKLQSSTANDPFSNNI